MEHENKIGKSNFWESVWAPDFTFKNQEKLSVENGLNACVVFCPLYKQGGMNSSELLEVGGCIGDSRVFGKIQAYKSFLDSLFRGLDQSTPVKIHFVVANKGVLVGNRNEKEDLEKLKYHNTLYKQKIELWAKELGFEYSFSDFFDNEVDFPTFVKPTEEVPLEAKIGTDPSKTEQFLLIEYLNKYLRPNIPVKNNSDNRHIAKSLIKSFGLNGAFWIVAGYLAFDNKIQELIGEGGLYIVSERFDPLFAISKFTPSLNELARVQIKA